MAKFNYSFQFVMLGLALILILIGLFNTLFFFYLLLLQIVVGVYQYITSCIYAFKKVAGNEAMKYHWYLSTLLLIVLVLMGSNLLDLGSSVSFLFFFIMPWILAVYFAFASYQIHKYDRLVAHRKFLNFIQSR